MIVQIPDPKDFKVVEKTPLDAVRPSGPYDVTVVTVVFNAVRAGRRERFVRCIESVQAQRGCGIEHLIVDGASKDGTVEIIRDYENPAIPIRYVSQADRGIYEAMNRGIALARGKYVVYLNSDDRFSSPQGLSVSFKALESSGADFSYASAHVVDEEGCPVRHVFETADEFINMFGGMTLCHQTILVRREAMVAVGGFDLAYRSAADYDLFLRVIYSGCRGVRVREDFVEFLDGGFSSVNGSLANDEVDEIFQRLYAEKLGMELPVRTVRRMREALEYPADLEKKILTIGETAFQRELRSAKLENPNWDQGVKWRFGQIMEKHLWESYDVRFLSDGWLRRTLRSIRFTLSHPIHALGAVRFGLAHRGDARCSSHDWLRVRCALMAERLLESSLFLHSPDPAGGGGVRRRSIHGTLCTETAKVTVPNLTGRSPGKMTLLLYACAYREEEQTAEVRLNGALSGRVLLRPDVDTLVDLPSLPAAPDGSGDAIVEIRLIGGGEFVFGGLLVGHAV